MNTSFICDRYSYFSGVFLSMLLVFVVQTIFKNKKFYIMTLFCIIFLISTSIYLPNWKNTETFWNYILQKDPSCESAYVNLGYYLMNKPDATKKDIEDALNLENEVIKLSPRNSLGYYNYGVCLQKLGYLQDAEKYYRQALEIKPDYSDIWNDLGVLLEMQDKKQDAFDCYKKALEFQPNHRSAINNANRLLQEQQKHQQQSPGPQQQPQNNQVHKFAHHHG